jgi:diacylglycerol kinase
MAKEFIRSRIRSFRNAFVGWWHVIKTQRNAWIHAVATFVVLLLAIWLNLSLLNWAILILTIAVVWTAEFLNTALEIVVDLTCPDPHPMAKAGKDVGAASVLIAALSAVVVGIIVIGPPLVDKLLPLFKSIVSIFNK